MKIQTITFLKWLLPVFVVVPILSCFSLKAQDNWETERRQTLETIVEYIMQEFSSPEADSLLWDLEAKALARNDSMVLLNIYMVRINSNIDNASYMDSVLDKMKLIMSAGGPKIQVEYQIDRSYSASIRGDYQLQIHHLDSATKLAEASGDSTSIYQTMIELAMAYQNVNDPQAALLIARDAREYARGNSKPIEEAYVLRTIGVCYLMTGRKDSALHYTGKAISIYEEIGNEKEKWYTRALQGNIQFQQGNLVQAKQLLQQAADSLFTEDCPEHVKNSYNQVLTWLAETRLATGDVEGAREAALKSFEFARNANQSVEKLEALKVFFRAVVARQANTSEYFETFLALQDSLNAKKNQGAVLEFERKYQTKEAEKKVLLLQQEAIEAEIKMQYIRFAVFIILALALVGGLVVGLLVLRARIRTKAQINDLHTKALQLQINPHFFFNVLNSISNFITQNDAKAAHLYLARLAKLMRLTLESSREDLVELGRETEFLKAYLELEQLRNDRFDFEVQCDHSLREALIPPLMIQPFAENAVLHAFQSEPGYRGKLLIRTGLRQGFLKVEIEDNGRGMQAGNEPKQEGEKKSLAISILEERLAKYRGKKGCIRFEVPFPEDKAHPGTRVIVEIPLNLTR